MKDYIKPTFTRAVLFPMALALGCTTSREEAEDVCFIFKVKDINTAFSITEDCEVAYNVMEYCKFTSVETGATKILTS